MFHHNHDGKLIECRYCSNPTLIKYGLTSGLGQRYKCKSCNKSFSLNGKRKKYNSFERTTVLHRASEQGIRKIAKAFHISPKTIRKRRVALVKQDTTKPWIDLNTPLQLQTTPMV